MDNLYGYNDIDNHFITEVKMKQNLHDVLNLGTLIVPPKKKHNSHSFSRAFIHYGAVELLWVCFLITFIEDVVHVLMKRQ